MITLENYLLYNEIVDNSNNNIQNLTINEGLSDFAKKLNNKIEGNVLDVTVAVSWPKPPVEFDITIGFPIEGIIIADEKGNDIISGKELKPVIDAFANGEYTDIAEELIKLFNSHSEDFAKTLKKGAGVEGDLDSMKLDLSKLSYLLKLERVRIYIPYTGKLSKLGVKLYQEFTIHFLLKPNGTAQVVPGAMILIALDSIKKLELNDFVIEGIGRINVSSLLKLYLHTLQCYCELMLSVISILFGQIAEGKPIKPDELYKLLKPAVNKSIKSNINTIKKLPDTVEIDTKIEEIVGVSLKELANSDPGNISIY